ncbi:tetratricopeptide repeat protein [Streptomyces sp. NPDC002446]
MADWELVAPANARALLRWIEEDATPQTVLWLNELGNFLAGANGTSVADALRGLFADKRQIVAIGTLWPNEWQMYAGNDSEPLKGPSAVGQLLGSALRVDVPSQFSAAEWDRASAQRALTFATKSCTTTRKLTQFLAATPDLLQRYADADPYSRALLTAAMDARRLGYRALLSPELLEHAAAGYLDDRHRADPPFNWFTCALRYATTEVKATVAPLTPLRVTSGVGPADGFRLADSLDEYARLARSQKPVPATLWDALVAAADDPDDLERLGIAAQSRCYYRYMALFCRPAAARGRRIARYLVVRNLEDQNRTEEARALRISAAEAGDTDEMRHLSWNWERQGRTHEAKEIWRRAAHDGDAVAQSGLAGVLAREGNVETAESWWRRAADSGHAEAMRELAKSLEGRGCAAEYWWRRAADAGDWEAAHRLSRLLEESDRAGQAIDIWHSRAALNDTDAMCKLARVLEAAGKLQEAEKWWRRAIDTGSSQAIFGLERLLWRNGNTEDAYQVVARAIAAGDTYVIKQLCKEFGYDITQVRGAERGLRRAYEAGEEAARDQLTDFLTADHRIDEAVALWLPAAEAGDWTAMRRMAWLMHLSGNSQVAERWMSRLADAGEGGAMALRAQILEQAGQLQEAERWERRVLETGYTPNPPVNLEYLLRTTGRANEADRLHSYGIEPGGRTAAPW